MFSDVQDQILEAIVPTLWAGTHMHETGKDTNDNICAAEIL
jgi:hypothetical protein